MVRLTAERLILCLGQERHFNSAMVRLTEDNGFFKTYLPSNFNSAMVRLTGALPMPPGTCPGQFQFRNGSINRGWLRRRTGADRYFNSAMVRLTAVAVILRRDAYSDFNSAMVRLTVKFSRWVNSNMHSFQFRNGSINRQ